MIPGYIRLLKRVEVTVGEDVEGQGLIDDELTKKGLYNYG